MVTNRNFTGLQKFVATRMVGTADGSAPPFARVAERHFASMDVLQAAATAASAQHAVAHAIPISSSGPPVVLVAEEETTAL
jgi:hypothetical protein